MAIKWRGGYVKRGSHRGIQGDIRIIWTTAVCPKRENTGSIRISAEGDLGLYVGSIRIRNICILWPGVRG